jgi:hypothetical protein
VSIESSRPDESWVERLREVGSGDDDDTRGGGEPVELCQELVDSLLGVGRVLCASLGSDRVELVDEDDRRRFLLGSSKQLSNPLGANSDEPDDKERMVGSQRLPCTCM